MFSKTISKKTHVLLVLKMIKGIGPVALWKVSNVTNLETKSIRDILIEIYPQHSKITDATIDEAVTEANRQLSKAYRNKDTIISYFDDCFPDILRKDPRKKIPLLFCRGNVSLLNKDIIAIVGTRKPTVHAVSKTKNAAATIVKSGKVVLSGLAEGIDTVAHETALEENGDTIAVIGTGLDKEYPKDNSRLYLKIAQRGLIISEFPYFTPVSSYGFVTRDYTQAALSKALILIQTGTKGGSLHATRAILGLNRPLYVVLPSEDDIRNHKKKCSGNLALVRKDATGVKEMLDVKNININLIKAI